MKSDSTLSDASLNETVAAEFLFCLFMNFKVKHIHVFSLEQQILE